jgi:hypothetical protein
LKRRTQGHFVRPMASRATKHGLAKPLYLIHITAVGIGREIVSQDILEARYCKHFDRKLVYFFINRPGYSIKNSNDKSDQLNRFPFVFIRKYDKFKTPFHAYPFDTGAALSGFFEDKEDPYIPLEDYELNNNEDGIKDHISWAFDNETSYFDGAIRGSIESELDPWQSTEKSFIDIANLASPQHNQPDKRASAIEVCYTDSFRVSDSGFHCVIPKQLVEYGKNSNKRILDDMNKKKISWSSYNWMPNRRPSEFIDDIVEIVRAIVMKA